MLAVLMVIPTITSVGAAEETSSKNVVEETITESEEDLSSKTDEEDYSGEMEFSETGEMESSLETDSTEETVEAETESVTDVSNETEESNDEAQSLDEAAVEQVIALFEDLPSITELDVMTPEEINETAQKANEAISAFDALPEAECQYIISNYSELYNYVMNEFSGKLMSLAQAEIAPMSLLPLEEKKAYLVVGDHEGVDISAVPVELVLNNLYDSNGNKIKIDENAKKVWSYYKDYEDNVLMDNYFEIDEGGVLDLSIFEEYDRYSLEMIVGDGNQLNPDNVRYIVTVYLSDTISGLRTYELYTQDSDGTRHEIIPDDQIVAGTNLSGVSSSSRSFVVSGHVNGTEYYLGVNDPLDEHPFIQCDVISFADYLGYILYQAIGKEYEYTSLSDQFLNQNMKLPDAGYKQNWDSPQMDESGIEIDNTFCFLYRDYNVATGEVGDVIQADVVTFEVVDDTTTFYDDAYTYENGQATSVVLNIAHEVTVDDLPEDIFTITPTDITNIRRVWLKEGYSPDEEYYYVMNVDSPKWENGNDHVSKAVVGIYDTLEEAANAEDISNQLLPKSGDTSSIGYKANYNIENGGVYFTVFFDDGTVWNLLVVFSEYDSAVDMDYYREYSDVPVIGEADPWFRITGVTDSNGNAYDTYVIENGKNINIDTMYGYGYQTVFINEDVESFIPTFWKADDEAISIENIYFNGSDYNEGDSLTFPEGKNEMNATFSVIIDDQNGAHTKNYNVTFVKRTSGPQLYVAGPLDPEVRSVFLDEYHENKHDIFIANVGDEPLTDLWLDLDATNVRLDDYWTVGGEGNNVLAACPDNFSLELDSTTYGELSNVAKIRLVPPEEGKGGEITGTLKIYSGAEGDAANSELLATINLSGLAQNPDIITSELDEAVKYVPYSYLVTTDNMYDWVDTSFELTAGSLPDGVELIPETGEIYGVPTETGEFTFTVTAIFDSTSENYDFEPVSKEYTLVVDDNTDDNVFNATDDDADDNYSILDAIGEDTAGDHHYVLNEYGDVVFRSEGEFGQFVDVWLNGEKLEPGVDYTAEEGSTRITIRRQTLEGNKTNKDGERNTIAAEFRTTNADSMNDQNNSNELKRTAQNFYIELNGSTNPSVPTDPSDPTVPTNPSVPGGSGNPSTPGYDGGSTGTGINTPGGSTSSGGQGGSQVPVSNEVNIVAHIVDANNAPMVGYQVELHSDVKVASTNSDGNVTFNGVEIGNHSIYVKDSNGAIVASKNFVIQAGKALSINGNTITAVPGQTFSMTIQVNGTQMVFDDLQVISTPETGDSTSLYIWLFLAVAAGLIAVEYVLISVKKKRVRRS